MKILIFLVLIVGVVFVLVRNMQKSRAKEALARRKSLERRKVHEKETLTPTEDVMWPVVGIAPRKGHASALGPDVEEFSMSAIEYEPPEKAASQ